MKTGEEMEKHDCCQTLRNRILKNRLSSFDTIKTHIFVFIVNKVGRLKII